MLDQQKKRRPAIDFVMFSMYVAAQLSPAAMFISQRAVIHGKPVIEPNKTKQQLFDDARMPAHASIYDARTAFESEQSLNHNGL